MGSPVEANQPIVVTDVIAEVAVETPPIATLTVPVEVAVETLVSSPVAAVAGIGNILETAVESGQMMSQSSIVQAMSNMKVSEAQKMEVTGAAINVMKNLRIKTLKGGIDQLAANPKIANAFGRAGPAPLAGATPRQASHVQSPTGYRTSDGRAFVSGKVAIDAGQVMVRVNGRWVYVEPDGSFAGAFPLEEDNPFMTVSLMGQNGYQSESLIEAGNYTGTSSNVANVKEGKRYAILIANQDYSGSAMPDLSTPVADVTELSTILNGLFGYETILVKDGSKEDIVNTIKAVGDKLQSNDKLMLYYAGHGYQNDNTNVGYWLPADAETDKAENWISNEDLSQYLNRLRSKHVKVVSDSCYSGSFVEKRISRRSTVALDEGARDLRAVTVLSSGGDEPVMDQGGAQGTRSSLNN